LWIFHLRNHLSGISRDCCFIFGIDWGSQFSFSLFGIDYVVGLHPWETGWVISEVFVRRFCPSNIIEANFGLGVPASAYYEAQSVHAISVFYGPRKRSLGIQVDKAF
jgi:hypothetical protein